MLETACPSDDVLGAHVEHALDDQEAARVVSHLDSCDACREIVVAAVRDSPLARGTPSLHLPVPIAQPRSLVGTRMGRYELRSLLGAGGMGQVYSAYDAELDREIAVKVLHPELARSAAVLADRLVRESRLMAKVEHPSVITVYDVGRTDGDAVFIAMELVRGETLAVYLARTKPTWRETCALFERAGAGLAAAHAAGIVHRDFKPDNVLVEGDARKVVVTDFGIAMDVVSASAATIPGGGPLAHGTDRMLRLTATGAAIGTPAYMAPEQLDAGDVDERADVFAFSVTLWEALFGERPFRGKTLGELRAAMHDRPRAPRSAVPTRLVRALERGIAITRDDRWPDMASLLRELAAIRALRRRALLAAGGIALVGAGIASALFLAGGSERVDPCMASLPAVPTSLPIDATATARLESTVSAWRTTHAATCHRDREPAQAPAVATCLEARKLEVTAFLDEVSRSGAKASPMSKLMLDPARCKDPRSGLLVARIPPDPAMREAVFDLRYRAFAIEAARDRSDFATALPEAQKLVDETIDAWPPLRAELMYLLGTTQTIGGDNKRALATLRETAALAERVHHDYIAANSWIQLIQATTFDEGNPVRALEYANYADAALDRIGRPPEVEVLLLYYRGIAMVEAHGAKAVEAEAVLRRGVELSEKHAPQYLDRALMGLAYLLESQGKPADAIAVYRKALETHKRDAATHVFHERLAQNLALLGNGDEAEREARKAVELAESMLGEDNADRALSHISLAQVLHQLGKGKEALAEIRVGAPGIAATLGERSMRYAEVLSLEASILMDLDDDKGAAKALDRACEIIAFGVGDDSINYADCIASKALALRNLGRTKEAHAAIDRAVEINIRVEGDSGIRSAHAYLLRAEIRGADGQTALAIADAERALAIFTTAQLDTGTLASARMLLAQLLWSSDKARSKASSDEAMALFAKAGPVWAPQKAQAEAWLANPK